MRKPLWDYGKITITHTVLLSVHQRRVAQHRVTFQQSHDGLRRFHCFQMGACLFPGSPLWNDPPPPKKTSDPAQFRERVCVLACVQTAPLSESKGKLSVLCCIQKWRKFIHTQESCNVEALSWWALEKEVDNQINSTVWYEQTFAGETIRHIHIYTHTPINTHV